MTTELLSSQLGSSQLGKKTAYIANYDPSLLFPLARKNKRDELGIDNNNPGFSGWDIWNHYEISWLNPKGKPQVACGEIIYQSNTPNIIESKSMKLYFNSFNNTKFDSPSQLIAVVTKDLSRAAGGAVMFRLIELSADLSDSIKLNHGFNGLCIDNLDVLCDTYLPNPEYLTTTNDLVTEKLYSNLLKSNCLVTYQPDWGSVYIEYTGNKIDHHGLLKYIVSLRDHNEFHEQCVERIFTQVMKWCKPQQLTVYARYTRRGGLDINPYRTTNASNLVVPQDINIRLIRQ